MPTTLRPIRTENERELLRVVRLLLAELASPIAVTTDLIAELRAIVAKADAEDK